MDNFAALILAFPLAGFLINGLLGRYLKNYYVSIIGCCAPLVSFIFSVITPCTSVKIFEWITVGGASFDLAIKIDSITQVMLLVITGVGFIIHVYSIGYMKGDPGYWRYFSYLNLFIFLMLLLVMADNLLVMFIGWEGVGLCSYLLIGFWYKEIYRADAAKKAFIVNRIGDFFFIIGMMILFSWSGSLNISDINIQTSSSLTPLVCIFLFIGACGKSAQFPLYVWLPDAMAGPTPVSALIHAATMVTAGVYMVARLLPLYMNFFSVLETIAVIGAFSALFTSILAIGENNIKRILAYSTISQLGFMFCGVAAGSIKAGFFHLGTHAFFKALLFLTAGIVIHALDGEEDIRKMGGLRKRLPLAFWAFLIGALSLSGIPPFSGFFSKEGIIHSTYLQTSPLLGRLEASGGLWLLITIILLLTTFFTSVYILRLIAIAFFGKPVEQKLHRADFSMTSAVVVLSILSLFGGFLGSPLENLLSMKGCIQPHTPPFLIALSIFASLAGLVVVFLSFGPLRKKIQKLLITRIGAFFNKLVANKFYVDEIYEYLFVLPLNMIAFVLWYIVDRVIIDTVVINSGSALLYLLSGKARKIQTGLVNLAVAIVALGVIFIIAVIFLLKHA